MLGSETVSFPSKEVRDLCLESLQIYLKEWCLNLDKETPKLDKLPDIIMKVEDKT